MNIENIKSPKDIKGLNKDELNNLAKDIRNFLLTKISKTGGHLSSNLGVVELTIALHYVFNAPIDKILFDVGHQSYVHKILTGRSSQFDKLRKLDGISGFQKRTESIYDCFEAGHSSTALSTSLGMAIARDMDKKKFEIIPVVGDASMMSGLSLEALNQIGDEKRKIIIIFNDNNMSINKNSGALKKCFASMRTNNKYVDFKLDVKELLSKAKNGKEVINYISKLKNNIKDRVIDSGIFKEFDIDYLGPIDGHNINSLINAFEAAKNKTGPCVVHVVTKKGKGYKYTEEDINGNWHGVGQFDIKTGEFIAHKKDNEESYSKIVADEIDKIMASNDKTICITPAMITGSKLNYIFKKYPNRCFDCGIAEDHAVLLASGLALSGKRPYVTIYSSFLQRAYDQINHDIARMDLPVVFGIDRSHLVGEDGATHHGVFDISFLRPLPNVIIAEGKDASETQNLLYSAFKQDHPYFVRYPRGNTLYLKNYKNKLINVGKWENIVNNNNEKCTIVSYGEDVAKLEKIIKENNLNYNLVNARFIKPIDYKLLKEILNKNKPIFVYTTDILKGGLMDEILEYSNSINSQTNILFIGIDDIFVEHGEIEKLKKKLHIDLNYFIKYIERSLNAKKSKR